MRFPLNTLPTLWVPDPARCPTLPCQSRDDLISLNLYEIEKEEQGLNVFPPGLTQRYNLSVQGGSALFQYYAAVDRSDDRWRRYLELGQAQFAYRVTRVDTE